MFNTLKYAKMLEEVGFSREQAETSIKILVEIMEDKLATKQDMIDLKQEIRHAKSELIIKTGAMISAAVALVVALHKLI